MANKKTLTPTSLPASLTLPEERKAEKALLFGLLASRKSLPEIAFRIRPEMFTHPDIALAIEAYLSLHG
ncbi:DNA helicase, partial [Paeniclostridium sordellii]|nr:DNA helicase [Paeniclostridium sordellii]